MFRGKLGQPLADIDRYLPEVRVYVRERLRRLEAVSCDVMALRAEGPRRGDPESMPFRPDEMKRNLSLLDSPAMTDYYNAWKGRESVSRTFSSEVRRMVGEKYKKTSDFYLPAGIDKRTFHKLQKDTYRPSRNTALKCCFGLGLGIGEAEELLQLAGYALSPSDPADLAVRFCLEKGIRDLASVNYLMASLNTRDLDGVEPGEMM